MAHFAPFLLCVFTLISCILGQTNWLKSHYIIVTITSPPQYIDLSGVYICQNCTSPPIAEDITSAYGTCFDVLGTAPAGILWGKPGGTLFFKKQGSSPPIYLYEDYTEDASFNTFLVIVNGSRCLDISTTPPLLTSTCPNGFSQTDWYVLDSPNGCDWEDESGTPVTIDLCGIGSTPECVTSDPTQTPTQSPTTGEPTPSPTDPQPTFSPTDATLDPTLAPSAAPTARPTNLPTLNLTKITKPDCFGMRVSFLSQIFPEEQSFDEFNQIIGEYYNLRRVWTNGVLTIHFEDRFDSNGGDWIITNGSYSMMSIIDANNGSEHTLPGPYPFGAIYYDHFPHDNILQKPDEEITLLFTCYNISLFPTESPTNPPTTTQPTGTPTTIEPTVAPTRICNTLCFSINGNNNNCPSGRAQEIEGCYIKQGQEIENKPQWLGVDDVVGYNDVGGHQLYYSTLFDRWTIDGNEGFSALIEGYGLYPPNNGTWDIMDQNNPFIVFCEAVYEYSCSATTPPTKAPSPAPTTARPTSGTPTTSPSNAPSGAPIAAPSNAPSIAPSTPPTASPIAECGALYINDTDYFNGMYSKQVTLKSGRSWWSSLYSDSEIFWSTSIYHETWILYSSENNRYWLSQTKPSLQPPLYKLWDLYVGVSPFTSDTQIIDIECFYSLPPTKAPTSPPTNAPSSAPSYLPSNAPSPAPSSTPSNAPTSSPTKEPTTLPPTTEPTLEPTYQPTKEPTAVDCDWIIITNPMNDPDLIEFMNEYNITNSGWETSDSSYRISPDLNTNGKWWINNTVSSYGLFTMNGGPQRPPFNDNEWYFHGSVYNISISRTILIDCAMTSAPSYSPSFSPSTAPTGAPTSSCRGLYFNNNDTSFTHHNGWYNRQDIYTINNHKWWISNDGLSTIEYIHGHWFLLEKDNDLNDDEDPVMLTLDGDEYLSPPSGIWNYVGDIGKDSYVDIICDATYSPTTDPTDSPSAAPTDYVAFIWEYCPDSDVYFTFIADILSDGVYWPLPTVNDDHLYSINISVAHAYQSGSINVLPLGMSVINYIATDSYGASLSCNVTLYIIGGSPYNSYKYCKKEKFNIEVRYNNTFYVIPDDIDIDEDDELTVDVVYGIVYDPKLKKEDQNCFVTAQEYSSYAAVVVSPDDSSSFLGMSANDTVWEVLALLLILCLICLLVDCLYRLYKDKKNRDQQNDDERVNLLENQQDLGNKQEIDQQAAAAGIATMPISTTNNPKDGGNTSKTNDINNKEKEKEKEKKVGDIEMQNIEKKNENKIVPPQPPQPPKPPQMMDAVADEENDDDYDEDDDDLNDDDVYDDPAPAAPIQKEAQNLQNDDDSSSSDDSVGV